MTWLAAFWGVSLNPDLSKIEPLTDTGIAPWACSIEIWSAQKWLYYCESNTWQPISSA
jgi:hypothetical protein